MADHEKDFTELVNAAGVPTTEAAIAAEFDSKLDDAGLTINNSSIYSPFWNLITRFFVDPVAWLIREILIKTLLPQSFLKTASGTFLEMIAETYDVFKKFATKTRGNITFTRQFAVGALPIPAGTIIQSPSINGKIYKLKTLAEAVIPDGSTTIQVLCEALEAGAAYNLADGYYTVLAVPIPNIIDVSNGSGWITLPGTDDEKDDDLRARTRLQFNTLSHYHIDAVYKLMMAQFAGVKVGNIFFVHDAPRGPGTANAYILFEQSAPAAEYIESINNHITGQDNHGHGDDLQVFNMPEDPQDIEMTWVPKDDLDADDIAALNPKIENFIRAAFRENTDYKPTLVFPESVFSFSLLGGELHAKFSGIKTLHFENDDITSLVTVPVINTLSVEPA